MLDLLIRGGLVVDGLGGPRRPEDVGVRDGRIVALEHVLVNGVEIVRSGAFTYATPGHLLRSGHDTATVTAPP